MKDLNNEAPIEVSQLCPKVSTSELLRAVLLFGLLFGMIALASLPQGILPTLALFTTRETDTESSPANDQAASQPRKDSPLPNDKSFPNFITQNGDSIQTIQATAAQSPSWENSVNQAVNGVPEANINVPLDHPPSWGNGISHDNITPPTAPHRIETDPAATARLCPPLDGVVSTGFTGWGYQKSPQIGGPTRSLFGEAELASSSIGDDNQPKLNGQAAPGTPPAGLTSATIGNLSARIEQLGALRYRLERWGNQGELFRFWCEMPLVPGVGTVAFFEAIASQPEEAMENVVRQVENWLKEAEALNNPGPVLRRQN